jgi:hypothetical protein
MKAIVMAVMMATMLVGMMAVESLLTAVESLQTADILCYKAC